jgi:hypothetical protein
MQELMEKSKKAHNDVDIEWVTDFIMCLIFGSVHNTSQTLAQCLCGMYNFISLVLFIFILCYLN